MVTMAHASCHFDHVTLRLLLIVVATSLATSLQDATEKPMNSDKRDVDISWYPPARSQVNNLTSALHASGVYGITYGSSANPNGTPGAYDWCNMPHVRPQDYVPADDAFELHYVELVGHRSGVPGVEERRTVEGIVGPRWGRKLRTNTCILDAAPSQTNSVRVQCLPCRTISLGL